jgi:hypothetical protein
VLWWVGVVVTGLGLAGLVALIGREAVVWLPAVPLELQPYFPRRVLFALAMNTDAPVLQVTVAGAVCWAVGRQRSIVARQAAQLATACRAIPGQPAGAEGDLVKQTGE